MKMIKLSYFISSVTTPSFANPSFVERKHELVAVCQYKKKNHLSALVDRIIAKFHV